MRRACAGGTDIVATPLTEVAGNTQPINIALLDMARVLAQ